MWLLQAVVRNQPRQQQNLLLVAGRSVQNYLLTLKHDNTTISKFSTTTTARRTTLWCGQVVFPEHGILPGSIDIVDDTIVACHPGESLDEAKFRTTKITTNSDTTAADTIQQQQQHRLQNLGNQFVLSPGLIDVHTHISALGRNWEGYKTATRAAAAGGITTIIGMPLNSIPPTTTLQAVEMEKQEAIGNSNNSQKLHVDVGLWGGVVPSNIADTTTDLEELLSSPYVLGLKAFLAPLPPAAGYEAVSPKQLLQAARVCAKFHKPILVHSELMTEQQCQQAAQEAFARSSSSSSYAAHLESRPAVWEQEAVKVVCEAAKICSMHIVHLSDGRGCLPLIEECKKQQSETSTSLLSVETCPHYLLLDEVQILDGDTRIKCFPPIRDAQNRELLWKGLKDGLIDMIASDHSPCEPHMRLMDEGDLKNAWGGLSGLQYQLQATWTEAVQRGFTPMDMAKWWSENPAKLAGMEYKGTIANGQQADLCWWDPDHVGAPNEYSQEHHRWPGTTFFADNPTMRGRVLGTWVRGAMVYDGTRDQHQQPAGKLLEYKKR